MSIFALFFGFILGCIFVGVVVAVAWSIFRESRILNELEAMRLFEDSERCERADAGNNATSETPEGQGGGW